MLTKESILKSLTELLVQYDCVIVPGFGGFVATQTSASIDSLMNAITPPTKRLSFNSQLQGNDGLFINALAVNNSVNYIEAEVAVRNLVTEFKQQLAEGNTVFIPSIGKLHNNENQKIIFTPSLGVNLLPESFGLKHISLPQPKKVVVNEVVVEALVAESDVVTETVKPKIKTNKAAYAFAMVAVAILFVGQVLFSNAQKDNLPIGQLSIGNFSTYFNADKKKPVTSIVPEFEVKRSFNLSYNANTENNVATVAPAIKEHITKVTATEDLQKGYYIIAGSFKSFENANTARKRFQVKGFEAKIIPAENNYYRVGIYVSEKISDVNEQIVSFKTKYQKQAWVMLSE
jgi:nucleoid DNA-binding protein